MGIKKTLGGNRLGSGGKMKVELKAYQRSTHNLSYDWKSSMACGVLTPFMGYIALNADTFDIDLNALVQTQPTIAPLYGSFKLQLDLFRVPLRIYNGVLHGNTVNIANKMNQVLMPMIEQTKPKGTTVQAYSTSSLINYLGIAGIGNVERDVEATREFFGVPFLTYYDIFKQYYANKQEKNAYVIGSALYETQNIQSVTYINEAGQDTRYSWNEFLEAEINVKVNEYLLIEGIDIEPKHIYINRFPKDNYEPVWEVVDNIIPALPNTPTTDTWQASFNYADRKLRIYRKNILGGDQYAQPVSGATLLKYDAQWTVGTGNYGLKPFPLENIDQMRYDILRTTALNQTITIDKDSLLPYGNLTYENNMTPMNGLCVKTYMSDLFNNWLASEYIDGLNGIAEVTKVDTSSGSFTMDALLIQKKVYNMMNLYQASGGTFQDWQEARYGETVFRGIEGPMYEGGASYEIGFEEVVSTADTSTEEAGSQPLGSLAGKGQIFDRKGGHVIIKISEPSFIMGIASITPRIGYSQGNKWYMTNIKTLEDLHAPELDGIGFQDLITEQMAWWSTNYDQSGDRWVTKSAGKQPAWLNYMTAVSEIHGDFAEENKAGFMVLDRKYQRGTIDQSEITDLTTYIDPQKYNYAFADGSLEAQNFRVQIAANVTSRRKMSAALIPTM